MCDPRWLRSRYATPALAARRNRGQVADAVHARDPNRRGAAAMLPWHSGVEHMALPPRAHEAMLCRLTHMHVGRAPASSLSLRALHFARYEAATPNRGRGLMGYYAGTGGS